MPAITVPPTAPTTDVLASFRAEIEAMNNNDVLTPRVDVAAAALTAIGAMPEIEAQRDAVIAVFGEAGARTIDRLPSIAQATMLAHAAHGAIAERDLEPMAQDLMEVRTRLFIAGSALIERGLADKRALYGLTGGQSYLGRVTDTMILAAWFETHASTLDTHSKVTPDEIVHARQMAEEFGRAYSKRDQARSGTSKTGRDRERTFTLFFRTYERVRQMLSYVRWDEDDVDQIAPSLFAGRRRNRRDPANDATPAVDTNTVAPGMPGASPFTTT
jgi:hypothetical protein